MSDMFVIQKLNGLKEQLDRIEQMLKEQRDFTPPLQITGAPAQRAYQKPELMPKMPIKVEKKK